MEKYRRRVAPPEEVSAPNEFKEIEKRLKDVTWAFTQLKQLERLPHTLVVEEIRTSLMEIVSGFTCINTINHTDKDPDPVLAPTQACKPVPFECSILDVIHKTFLILRWPSLWTWRTKLVVYLLPDIIHDIKQKYLSGNVPMAQVRFTSRESTEAEGRDRLPSDPNPIRKE